MYIFHKAAIVWVFLCLSLLGAPYQPQAQVIPVRANVEHVLSFRDGIYVTQLSSGHCQMLDANGTLVGEGFDFAASVIGEGDAELYGYVDDRGNLVIPCIYDNLGAMPNGNYWVQDQHGRYGIVDVNNEWVLSPEYDLIASCKDFLLFEKDGEYQVTDYEYNVTLPWTTDELRAIPVLRSARLTSLMDTSQAEYYARHTNEMWEIRRGSDHAQVSLEQYQDVSWQSLGCFKVRGHNGWGLVHENGSTSLAAAYVDVENFKFDGTSRLYADDEHHRYITASYCCEILALKQDCIPYAFSPPHSLVICYTKGNAHEVHYMNGEYLLNGTFDAAYFTNEGILTVSNKHSTLWSYEGKVLYSWVSHTPPRHLVASNDIEYILLEDIQGFTTLFPLENYINDFDRTYEIVSWEGAAMDIIALPMPGVVFAQSKGDSFLIKNK